MNTKEIRDAFEAKKRVLLSPLHDALSNLLLNEKLPLDIADSISGEIILPANRKITKETIDRLSLVHDRIEIDKSPIRNKIKELIDVSLRPIQNELSELEKEYKSLLEKTEIYKKKKVLEVAAKNGDPRSQYELGLCYYDSHQIWYDCLLAENWFFKSALQGNQDAQHMYDKCCEHALEASGLKEEKFWNDLAEATVTLRIVHNHTNTQQLVLMSETPFLQEIVNLFTCGPLSEYLANENADDCKAYCDGKIIIRADPMAINSELPKLLAEYLTDKQREIASEMKSRIEDHRNFVSRLARRFTLPVLE